ncbi:NACHT domain protein [Pseudonocardia autotrophica]|nr:NACHT domain protein [Pseudonocardia autotrophica]
MNRAGQAGEVGSVFRTVVALHLAVHGLRGRTVAGLDLPSGVDPIRLDFETSDPTDDIRITFSDGRRAYVSAKRKVTRGRPLIDTVAGWAVQGPTLGPDDLLIIAGEEFTGPAKNLQRVLRRYQAGLRMETRDEIDAFKIVDDLLAANVREIVLDRARVLHLPSSTGIAGQRDFLAALMDLVVVDAQGPQAVSTLADLFHRQAGEALGSGIDDWVVALNSAGTTVIADEGGPAGMRAAAMRVAIDTYHNHLSADVGRIDLSLLAEDVPPILIEDLIDGIKIDVEGISTPHHLLHTLRRWRRMLLVGQPGAGKSVALREIAAHCAAHPHAPTPIRVSLPRLMKQQSERLTIDGIISVAVSDLASANQRGPLAEYLARRLADGHALILCDGLDECGTRAPWVAQQLAGILGSLHPRAGFVLATRANAKIPAARLGLPKVELAPPNDLSETVDSVLRACAETRVPESGRDAWLATRRAWIQDARNEHKQLLTVPLLAILLTLICASAEDVDLPKGRAMLLHRAIEQSIRRWEQMRETLALNRPWSPDLTPAMLLNGFVVLGRILDGGATPLRADAIESLNEMLKRPDRWAMPPAQANEVAEQVLRFWDEHVAVFILNPAGELTTRSKVFAEIATAMWAAQSTQDELMGWIREVLPYTDSDGAITLAAGLDQRTVMALVEVGSNDRPEATLMVVDLAIRGVVALAPTELERVLGQLQSYVHACREGGSRVRRGPRIRPKWLPTLWDETREPGPWPFVQAATLLPLSEEYRVQRANLVADAALDERSGKIARALCELTDATVDMRPLGNSGATAVNAAMAIELPPESSIIRKSRRRSEFVDRGRLAPGLAQVALAAADHLDELADDAGERAFRIAMRSPVDVAEGVFRALERAGVDTSRRWKALSAVREWLTAHREDKEALVVDLASLAEPNPEPEYSGLWSFSDIGDLLEAIGYQEVGLGDFRLAFMEDDAESRRAWLDAMADAYGLDKHMIARQARYLQQECDNPNDVTIMSADWAVASTRALVTPSLVAELDAVLTAEQQRVLLTCLESASDWIAFAAANVLSEVSAPVWDGAELLEKDMSSWHRLRAGVLYSVGIVSAGGKRAMLLEQAAESASSDYRYAAQMTISLWPVLDSDGSIMKKLCDDTDMSVRPKEARTSLPLPDHWSCDHCRAINEVDVEDCAGCDNGVRPDS